MRLRLFFVVLLLPTLVVVVSQTSEPALFDASQDCGWDCVDLDGQALQTFSEATGPGDENGVVHRVELARLDIQTGDYVMLSHYASLMKINAVVFWRDNVTYPGHNVDKLFVVEKNSINFGGANYRNNYLVQLCPSDDTFFRRAVLPQSKNYYVASASNDGTMWMSAGGKNFVVNIPFADIATNPDIAISYDDQPDYTPFNMPSDTPSVGDLAWYDPCQKFIGINPSGSTVSDSSVVLYDYDSQSTQSFTFPDGIDGPQDQHKAYGACYSFAEGSAVFCSGNGNTGGVDGALYAIEMDPETCEPTKVTFRVDTQSSASNDGTTCRFPGTLPCVPAYVSAPTADVCPLNRIMGANLPSDGGSGQWTLIEAESTLMSSDISFSDVNDPNAVVTADLAGVAKLRWTLTAPLCSDSSADIRVTFGYSCCYENEYVNSNNACLSCPGALISAAGADPAGPSTQCVWPICPDNSVWLSLEYRCRCVTGYTNDPVWTGASYTDSCKKICKFCTS